MTFRGIFSSAEETEVQCFDVCYLSYQLLTWYSAGHSSLQGGHRSLSNVCSCVLGSAALTCGHHVGLQQGTLQIDMVLHESLVGVGEHLLCHLLYEKRRDKRKRIHDCFVANGNGNGNGE